MSIFIVQLLHSQNNRPLILTADGILLHSTHKNNFPGVSAGVLTQLNKHWLAGGGAEYSWSPSHDDNGWKLTSLRFAPLYGDFRWYPWAVGIVKPYVRCSVGISFNSYKKVDEFGVGPYQVREFGLFSYGGIGANIALNSRFSLLAEAGLKGFRMSFNNLDVNPHGITYRVGLSFVL